MYVDLAAGPFDFPVPETQSIFQKPQSAPRVAHGLFDLVLVDVTQPSQGSFSVRIYEEGDKLPEAQIHAVFLFYGASVEGISKSLERAWELRDLKAILHSWSPTYWQYNHSSGIRSVLATIEKLQGQYLP